jgi:PAS domain S-box-containing protein
MLPDMISVLLVSEQAEEVKLTTKALRSFYPGCRVEAVYSSGEAMEWAAKQDWHLILLDESLLDPHMGTLREVRRRAPRSAVIIAAIRQDTVGVLELMRQGADYSVLKNTPVFLTELPIVTREVLEKRALRARLELAQDRHLRLIGTLTDMAYELDAEGRFLHVSPAVRSLLHYDPQELIGRHFSTLIPPEDVEAANRRFNERRSESRATRRLKLRLLDKDRSVSPLAVEINATALYDRHRHFVGTIGLIRSTVDRQHRQALQRLTDLPPSLTLILSNMERLLQTVQDLCEQVGLSPTQTAPTSRSPRIDERTFIAEAPSEQSVARAPDIAPSFQERRQSPRIEVQMEARAISNGNTWEGTALNISLGGIFIIFTGQVAASEHQKARLGFGNEIGILEIQGTMHHMHARPSDPAATSRLTGLAFRFDPLKEVEAKILHSLIEGLRAGSIVMTCTALLIPRSADSIRPEASHSAMSGAEEYSALPPDRRQATRVNVDIPVQIECSSLEISLLEDASLTNLSAGGACARLQSHRSTLGLLGQRVTLRMSIPPNALSQSALDRTQAEYRLTGDIMWATADAVSTSTLRLGLRFVYNHASNLVLTALLDHYLTLDRVLRSDEPLLIATDFLECTNARGQRIALCHDHQSANLPLTMPLVIVAPGYGRNKTDYVELAHYFVANGYHVLRYDHSCHVGESDGGVVLTTLTNMQEDLRAIMEYAVRLWPGSHLVAMASDVAARVALKAMRQNSAVKLLVLLAPVLDIQYTLMAVHQEDLIKASLQGMKRGIRNILGLNVDADMWLSDAIGGAYADFQTAREDVAEIRIPVIVFSSEQDLWTRPNSFAPVKAALGDMALAWHTMPEARHGVTDHPDQSRLVFRQIVAQCRTRFSPFDDDEIAAPMAHHLVHQRQLERERARLHHQMGQAAAVEFWRDYLDRSHSLVNFSEYWHVLDHIHRLLGPLDTDIRLLDAGCGNGHFGMFLLIAASFRSAQLFSPENRFHYVGVDLVPGGLAHAKINLIRVAAELRGKFAGSVRPQSVMKAGLACMDLNASLPFQDGRFDRVVCNLVLGYLRDPLFTLRELVRVLSPRGRLVLTHFKPEADLDQIYGRLKSPAKSDVDTRHVNEIMEAPDRISQPSREASFRFFDRQELAMLLVSSGASQPRIYSTFANQAYIAVAEKSPTSAPSQ